MDKTWEIAKYIQLWKCHAPFPRPPKPGHVRISAFLIRTIALFGPDIDTHPGS